ncbi:histidine phosphatase family protein [Acinetobacter sp. B5B]|uniref:SixA phosphatase family protein n=1 Tax=Acinetobacter baretiae TaxID=2605383 RepID=UPI0018C2EEF7|nr:phosphoglycerate mutase family protein [Acinetobacter baretiae]MBF7682134.1 histidine phosphatase family protein [Acinetobacter baretiae]MBF7684623.1 histidine phosphatase family protein [Acinetobacter baretiae]
MQLTLVRHGEAHPAGSDHNDVVRQLTPKGHTQAAQTADFLKENITQPDLFVVSPLVRAQQTLKHIQQKYPNIPVMLCDYIKPDDEAELAVEWLSYLDFEHVVVVCHMNIVAHIEEILVQQPFHPFALAEARIYEQTVLTQGLSTLKAHFVPKD